MVDTKIEWANKVWNPTTGCTKVSPGCSHCYAETVDHRFDHDKVGKLPWAFPASRGGRGVTLHPDRLELPFHWKKPKRIFVNSMSDLFHEDVPKAFIGQVFLMMARCPQHTFQVLTKRPDWMAEVVNGIYQNLDLLSNVWLGVSVESQHWADIRIPALLKIPARVHFVSAEPLLARLDLNPYLYGNCQQWGGGIDGRVLDWVITGGESGPKARPADPHWFEQIRDDCQAAGVPFFMKQDSGPRPGLQGRISDELWSVKEFPDA